MHCKSLTEMRANLPQNSANPTARAFDRDLAQPQSKSNARNRGYSFDPACSAVVGSRAGSWIAFEVSRRLRFTGKLLISVSLFRTTESCFCRKTDPSRLNPRRTHYKARLQIRLETPKSKSPAGSRSFPALSRLSGLPSQ